MFMNDFQRMATETAVYPFRGHSLTYPALGLAGEAGEVANQMKKVIRDDGGIITADRRAKLIDELGDVLWYAAALAGELKTDLGTVAAVNLDKLRSRRERGTLGGSGDGQ